MNGPRLQRPTLEPVYQAVSRWVDAALVTDDSAFTPGVPVWSVEHVDDFYERFVVREQAGHDSFMVKLERQLDGASDRTKQMAAELMFVHCLGIYNQSRRVREDLVLPILRWMAEPVQLPAELQPTLDDGVANFGPALMYRWAHIRFLVTFVRDWKRLPEGDRQRALEDPWAFREQVFAIDMSSARSQQNILLHLVFPDVFEPFASEGQKQLMVDAFGQHVPAGVRNIDEGLQHIRKALEPEFGPGFEFYSPEIIKLWKPEKETAEAAEFSDPQAVRQIAEMIESFYPDSQLRSQALETLARVAVAAHDHNTTGWMAGVDNRHTYMGINVGRVVMAFLFEDRIALTLDDDVLSGEDVGYLEELTVREPAEFKTLPTLRYWKIPPDGFAEAYERVEEALFSAVGKAATAARATPYARYHSRSVVEYLRAETGIDVPFPEYSAAPAEVGWDEFTNWVGRFFERDGYDEEERAYKLEIAKRIRAAREAVLSGEPDWFEKLKRAFTKDSNLTPWQAHDKFLKWCRSHPDEAAGALRDLWQSDAPAGMRIDGLLAHVPTDALSGKGARLAVASFLLMVNETVHPIHRPTPFQTAFKLTEQEFPSYETSEGATYEASLVFLDQVLEHAYEAGIGLRDRLDAQSVVFSVTQDQGLHFSAEERARLLQFRGDTIPLPKGYEPEGPLAGFTLPAPFTTGQLDDIPGDNGVHAIWSDEGDLLYVGHSGRQRDRLRQYLSGHGSVFTHQVGEMLTADATEQSTSEDAAAFLATCTFAWKSTPRPKELKSRIIDELQPRLNRAAPKPPETPKVWWVNQGSNFDDESGQGYVFAGVATAAGHVVSHHRNVDDLRVGDLVVHYAQGSVRAMSSVTAESVIAPRPGSDDLSQGYFAELEYAVLDTPIDLSELDLSLRRGEGGPFTQDGKVNQGYLYPLSDEFAGYLQRSFAHAWPLESVWGGGAVVSYEEPPFIEILERFRSEGFKITEQTLRRYHTSLKTRGFVILSGVSGTGKSWLTRVYADAVKAEVKLVPVAPNWTSNEDLIGFFNPVTESYVDTDFSRFLRRAAREYEAAVARGATPRPFFLVLDEMNLARVEYYFAKFLSAMEARSGGEATIELAPNEHVLLPLNLYAVGTVNVDETTHGFADKVYDRAQVIELTITEADLDEFIGDVDHRQMLMEAWRAVREVAPFAYRVADEIAHYIEHSAQMGSTWQEALDHQILQKVLPKLARPDPRIETALGLLIEVCGDFMPLSRAKAEAMLTGLRQHGFVSYF